MENKITCSCENCDLKTLFFDNIIQSDLDNICSRKFEKNYKSGDIIIESNTPIKDFIYLKSGLVKLYKVNSDGREQIITIAKPFDFVSILSVFSDKNYNYSVTALEDSVICSLDFEFIKSLILNNAHFGYNILSKMSGISDKIILDMLAIKTKHLRGRVAHLLLYFSNNIYNNNEFDLPISRREIAEYIGMTTENVIRTLSEFRKDKIIKIFGKTIEIIDKTKLTQISELG